MFKLIKKIILIIVLVEMIPKIIIYSDYVLNSASDRTPTVWIVKWLKNKNSNNIKDSTKQEFNKFDKYLGWSPKNNFTSENININKDGIRGKTDYSVLNNKNKLRIATSGESTTFGEDVADNETYSSILEKNIKNSEVLNFGGSKYGIDQISIRVEKEALEYKPNIIVYGFTQDGIYRSKINFRDYMKPRFSVSNEKLELEKEEMIEPEVFYKENKNKASINYLSKIIFYKKFNEYSVEEYEKLLRAIWKKTIEDANSINSLPIFVYLPHSHEMKDVSVVNNYFEKILFEFCEAEKVNCFSAREYILSEYKNGLEFNEFAPYDKQIHKIIADGLSKDLNNLYNIPKPKKELEINMLF